MQSDIVLKYRQNLFFESFDGLPEEAGSLYDSPWDYLQQNTVPGYIKIGTFGRRLASDPINQCESTNWFSEDFHSNRNHLSAIWITKDGNSLLEPNLVLEMCKAERLTAEVLGREGFCSSCAASICLEPHSLIYLISSELGYSKEMSTCEEIVEAYSPLQDDLTQRLVGCANAMRLLPGWNCTLQAFASTLVDSDFGVDDNIRLKYSSSIFFTSQWIEEDDAKILYRLYPSFGRTDSKILSVVYDTKNQDLNILSQIDIMTDDVVSNNFTPGVLSRTEICILPVLKTKQEIGVCIGSCNNPSDISTYKVSLAHFDRLPSNYLCSTTCLLCLLFHRWTKVVSYFLAFLVSHLLAESSHMFIIKFPCN
jgi:hypothetical protein